MLSAHFLLASMGDKTKKSSYKSKKKIPSKFTKKRKLAAENASTSETTSSASRSNAKKLCKRLFLTKNSEQQGDTDDLGNGIVDMDIVVGFLQKHFKCTECSADVNVNYSPLEV